MKNLKQVSYTKEQASKLYHQMKTLKIEVAADAKDRKQAEKLVSFWHALQNVVKKCDEEVFVRSLVRGELPTVKLSKADMAVLSGGDFGLFKTPDGKNLEPISTSGGTFCSTDKNEQAPKPCYGGTNPFQQ